MVGQINLRPFRRKHDGVLIYLRLDEWPTDVPLPAEPAVVETGDGPFMPYWRLVFEPEQTVEVVVGWFKFSCSLDETVIWHQNEMERCGWVRDTTRGFKDETSAGMNFQHPQTGVKVEMSFRWWRHLHHTTVMIRRVVKHPWPPADELGAGAPELPLPHEAGISE